MFESNGDIDFNDEIFTGLFDSEKSTTKRPNDCEKSAQESKKVCSTPVENIEEPPDKTKQLLERISSQNFNFLKPDNVSSSSLRIANRIVVPRKFPGPAGLLTDLEDHNFNISSSNTSSSRQNDVAEHILCSQLSAKAFGSEPWCKMLTDFDVLTNKYNIAWIKEKAVSKELIDQKAPFLAAIIDNVKSTKEKSSTVSVLLKDVTGEIEGSIQHDLYEEYCKEFVMGCVVVLKQFSVLTTSFSKNHYLTITSNNLVAFYGDSKVVKIQKLTATDLCNLVREVEQNYKKMYMNSSVEANSARINLSKSNEPSPRAKKGSSEDEVKIPNSQIIIRSQNVEHEEILRNVFDDLDADSLFEEF